MCYDPVMTKDDVQHLASLARIKLTDAELETFATEIDAVLQYVSAINDIVADADLTKKVGPVHNVFRADAVTNEPENFTEAISNEFPDSKGRFLKVKKILNPSE